MRLVIDFDRVRSPNFFIKFANTISLNHSDAFATLRTIRFQDHETRWVRAHLEPYFGVSHLAYYPKDNFVISKNVKDKGKLALFFPLLSRAQHSKYK